MERTKKISVSSRNKFKRKNRRLVRSIVAYLKSNDYLFAPLFSDLPPSNPESSKADGISTAGLEILGIEGVKKKKKKKRRMSEKVKEYLKSYNHMYGRMISPPKLGSSLKGKLQITNLVTMEVSTSTTTIREDNDYRNLRSEIAQQTLQNGKLDSPKRGQTNGLSSETDLLPAFSSLPVEKVVKPYQRRVTIE